MALKPMDEPCSDCPVVFGMYQPFSEKLALLPKPDQLKASEKWFCHTDHRRACRGNWNFLELDKYIGENENENT